MVGGTGEQQQQQQQPPQQQLAFPPPPPFYKLYGPEADGTEGRPLPLPPPPPIEGEYPLFGEIFSTEDGIPPLTVRQLFNLSPEGRVDFKRELGRLNKELLFAYLDLLDCLVKRPSAYARSVENVGVVSRNMAYLLNALRAHQARATLEHTLKVEVGDRKEAIQELREGMESAQAVLNKFKADVLQRCAAISGEEGAQT